LVVIAQSLTLLLALGMWGTGLHFAVRPIISSMPLGLALAVYILPPFVLWTGWLAMRWRTSKLQQQEAERRTAEEASRCAAERAAAHQRHEDELQLRRFHCDCRALAISVAKTRNLPLADTLPPNTDINILDDCMPHGAISLQRLRPAIENVLRFVYSTSPAAVLLPIYVVPPTDIPGNDVLELVHIIRAGLAESVETDANHAAPILFLPTATHACDGMLALFENAPDLPGAIVLAFDSPLARLLADEVESEAQLYPHEYPNGFPNEGAVALLVTSTELARMLEAVSAFEPLSLDEDALMPFWERASIPEGLSPLLARMDRVLRAELGLLPIIGCIHRASVGTPKSERSSILEMTRLLQSLLEQAQVDTGLIDKPFMLEDADNAESEVAQQRPRCARLVHNAGNAGTCGKRLAALGSAMLYFGIDFSPVDPESATNAPACLGNLGCASAVAQLALGIAHAAQSAAPALCATFSDRDSIALSIAMPPSALA
jgi:hypothetical protein